MRDDERLTFMDGDTSITWSHDSPYWWKDQEGMGGLTANIFTTNKTGGDGVTVTGSRNPERLILIIGQIRAKGDEIAVRREELLRALRPKRTGILIYECSLYTRYIPCTVQSSPEPSRGIFPEFEVEFLCPSPYWRGGDGTKKLTIYISRWVPNIIFPFVFDESGIVCSYRSPSLVTNLENTGDEDLPLSIEFYFGAAASNPKITNIQTQEYLTVEGDFVAGDLVRIETDDDKLTATLIRNGIETNIFNDVPEEATWLKFYTGDNYLRAEASDDNNVETTITCDDMWYNGV